MKRNYQQSPLYVKDKAIRNIWDHIYGAFTVIGFLLSTGYTAISIINHEKETSLLQTTGVLTVTLLIMSICFLIIIKHYRIRLGKLDGLDVEFNEKIYELKRTRSALVAQAETIHTITHYYRAINNGMDNFISKLNNDKVPDISEFSDVLQKSEYFLINFTSSVRSYFNLITGTNNAITIKIVGEKEVENSNGKKEVEKWVKTFFRDPVSLKKRRIIEKIYKTKSGRYLAEKNKAFEIILDEKKYFDSYFASDNLASEKDYSNENKMWLEYYSACIVVPISIFIEKNERKIIGFLTVDNKEGNLNISSNIEFMFAISDLFYCFFAKYIEMIKFASLKYEIDVNTTEYSRIQRVLYWD